MRPVLIALSVALGLASGAAFAQHSAPSGAQHSTHHPQGAQAPSAQLPATGQAPAAAQMPEHSGPGSMMGMMSCPMMQSMMGGRGMMPGMSTGAQRGDESVPSLALKAASDKMHRDMVITYTGNVDADFAKTMVAHHQGAIDMAKITLAFGKDAQIRRLAEDIVKAQEAEIAALKEWLARTAR